MDATLETTGATTGSETGLTVGADTFDIARHNGTITLVSPRTGDHRTFRIRTVKDRRGPTDSRQESRWVGRRLVELLTGPDNGPSGNWQAFGEVTIGTDGEGFLNRPVKVWYRFTNRFHEKPGRSDFEVFADMLAFPSLWAAKGVEYMASLACRRCGRALTHPSSLMSGYGPECIKKVMG